MGLSVLYTLNSKRKIKGKGKRRQAILFYIAADIPFISSTTITSNDDQSTTKYNTEETSTLKKKKPNCYREEKAEEEEKKREREIKIGSRVGPNQIEIYFIVRRQIS